MAVIRVINPNSNQQVTEAIARGLTPFAMPGRVEIVCETLESSPIGIQSQRDVESVVLPLAERMKAHPADAFVIACYSDPGLVLCRAEIRTPVFGSMESAFALARTRGERIGVIALSANAVLRHRRMHRTMGVEAFVAGERPVEASVAESAGAEVYEVLRDAGEALRDTDGADIIVLGCAGMARHRAPLCRDLGIPVIDPTQAAVTAALGALLPEFAD